MEYNNYTAYNEAAQTIIFDATQLVSNPLVKNIAYRIRSNNIILAVITEPIFMRSEREKLLDTLAAQLLGDFQEVIVSLDTEVFYRATRDNVSYSDLEALALVRGNSRIIRASS